ncbi:M23 family metallopeptidase [Pseudanabaena mucicola]|uniref:M23 family metallopeptidase n=1 Tax=Pseudanabaena mucicola FACHB-723 TaxID=2692860 RepID=A0ABR7ZUB7_9CYAN|nr:M23 family metallopeptidase [Pseudanabaena mucicola]MBD2187394.1 M23 family metallopeptidase [Pseudanabaena mucicola FACHB-723]
MRKSTLSTLTLATLLCFSTTSYLSVSSAYAATKSAISPDISVSQPSSTMTSEPAAVNTPASDVVDIKIENNAGFTANDKIDNSQAIAPPPVQVNIQTNSQVNSRPITVTESEPEIILENRSTGCKFKASSLMERDAALCNPEIAIAAKQQNRANSQYQYATNDGGVLYAAASGETAVQVRRLTEKEIAAMSLPSNGDKQMLFPLIAPSIISSIFGSRVHPVTGQVRFHQGTDLAAPEGTPVVASFSGRVEIAGWLGGYGLIVVISHGDTHETRYAHLSEVLVKEGQEVKQGTVIGLVGSTGMATGPHLHFEIWQKMQDGLVAIDPTPQLILAMEQLQKYLAQSQGSPSKA